MEGTGSSYSTGCERRQVTPPRPKPHGSPSPRSSPPGPRPPVPKKPPIAHVKPLSPRGNNSPRTPPSVGSSPSRGRTPPNVDSSKVPPPLPKVAPKGGTETEGVIASSLNTESIVPNGRLHAHGETPSPDPTLAAEDNSYRQIESERKSPEGSAESSPGRSDVSDLSSSTNSGLGNLSLNAAGSFFEEVMSAICHADDAIQAHEGPKANQSCKPEIIRGEFSTSVDEKGDNEEKCDSENKKNLGVLATSHKFLSPSCGRPMPKKRLSLTNSGEGKFGKENISFENDQCKVNSPLPRNHSQERPALKPKPVPRKRLPLPNLSNMEKAEKTSTVDIQASDSVVSSTPSMPPASSPAISPPPSIPSKLKARCKGRLSLDTYFPRPQLHMVTRQCSSPLSSSFAFGDGSDSEETPRRPPRPKRMKTLQGIHDLSLSFSHDMLSHSDLEPQHSTGSVQKDKGGNDSSAFLDSPSSSRKACPPKPKRKTLPSRVNRSFSDVTSAVGFVSHVESQSAAKENFLNGQAVHSRVGDLQTETESRSRSKTSNAVFSELDHSFQETHDPDKKDSHLGRSPQRFNPFDRDTNPMSEGPDFHSESPSKASISTKRSADVLSPSIPNKNNNIPPGRLKPTRKAPSPPNRARGTPQKDSLTRQSSKELNNNTTSEQTLNTSPPDLIKNIKISSKEEHTYEIAQKKGVHDDAVRHFDVKNDSVPVVPPRVSMCRKSILEMTPAPPPCAPPRAHKEKNEEDDGYIYPEDVPVEFAPSNNWPKDKGPRPQSSCSASSELTKVHYGELPGSPRSVAKLKHLSLLSEGSSQSDHSSDSQRRMSSFLDDRTSSEDSVTGDGLQRIGPKREKVYYVVEEIVKSEKIFVDVLKLMNVEFRMAVSSATEKAGKPVIPADTLNKILNFLPQLQNFNEDLLKDFTKRLEHWDEEKKVADIFVRKGPFLKLYTSYIKNFEDMTELLKKSCEKHPAFAAVVKEFERNIDQTELVTRNILSLNCDVKPPLSPRCASLALRHYMLKPIQRIPQYKLLLQDYKKHLTPDSPDYKDTDIALSIVSEVANHANESMRYGDTVQKMLSIQHSLIGQFEVIKPGRTLVKQGELLKLSRKEMQPRMFFLFSDVLLYTTPVANAYKLNNVLSLTSMKVRTESQEEYKNEFSIISVRRSFTLTARSAEEKEEWLTALREAIEENAHKRSTFDFGRINSQPDLTRDFTLGSKAPVWIPDSRVTMCMLCTCEFTVTWRRHHCRACGKVVCGSCSESRAPLQYLNYKINRVCNECFDDLQEDIEERSKNLGRGESLEPQDSSSLSISNIKARFLQIRRSARTLRGSGNKKRPAVLKEVHANDQGSTMSGYLKQHKGKKWRKLWFVLKDKVLYTYKASEDTAAIESYPLLGYEVVGMTEIYDSFEPGLVFQCIHKNTEPLVFRTGSKEATRKWIEMMSEASVP